MLKWNEKLKYKYCLGQIERAHYIIIIIQVGPEIVEE